MTQQAESDVVAQRISIHALRVEGDRRRQERRQSLRNFNPRPPCGGRLVSAYFLQSRRNFNPRPPWGGRQFLLRVKHSSHSISIHALRGEGDVVEPVPSVFVSPFQSTPSAGRATTILDLSAPASAFQSTPSVGRATYPDFDGSCVIAHFNPRPPWGGRPIHDRRRRGLKCHFNPRPPWGGRPADLAASHEPV